MSGGKRAAACFVLVGCTGWLAAAVTTRAAPGKTTGGAAAAPADPARPSAPLPGKWKLVWHDEFDGDAPGRVWHTAQYWDKDHTLVRDELQAYDATAVSVAGGMLHLTARAEAKYGRNYVSGLVQAGGVREDPGRPTFSFTFGCLEVRAKLPAGKGLWPAVWMMPASYDDRNGELDVLEVIGSRPRVAHFSLHRNGGKNTKTWTGPDFSQGFHTFAVDWRADRVTWYVDGAERARMTDKALICPEAMYPILNLAVGGDWPGAPDAATKFPATMDVDYVRVWQPAP
jgi:beta-glucanase (GH16 family)